MNNNINKMQKVIFHNYLKTNNYKMFMLNKIKKIK